MAYNHTPRLVRVVELSRLLKEVIEQTRFSGDEWYGCEGPWCALHLSLTEFQTWTVKAKRVRHSARRLQKCLGVFRANPRSCDGEFRQFETSVCQFYCQAWSELI